MRPEQEEEQTGLGTDDKQGGEQATWRAPGIAHRPEKKAQQKYGSQYGERQIGVEGLLRECVTSANQPRGKPSNHANERTNHRSSQCSANLREAAGKSEPGEDAAVIEAP